MSQNADAHEWLRKGPATTLGELFRYLGTDHTAKAIYGFYRTCRLIVLKKKKDHRKPTGTPGSASGSRSSSITGVTGSPLQASAIRAEYPNKRNPTHGDALVDEYVQVKRSECGLRRGNGKATTAGGGDAVHPAGVAQRYTPAVAGP